MVEVLVRALERTGGDVLPRKPDTGATPFFLACQEGHDEIVDFYLKAYPVVNSDDPICGHLDNNASPLFAACYFGHDKVIESIFPSRHFRYDCPDDGKGNYPECTSVMTMACEQGNRDMARLYIEYIEAVEAEEQPCCAPSYFSVMKYVFPGFVFGSLFRIFWYYGSVRYNCPVHWWVAGMNFMFICFAGENLFLDWVPPDELEINKKLVSTSNSPLYIACDEGHTHLAQDIISSRGDVNTANRRGETALFTASVNGDLDIMRLLLKNGADINQASNDWETPYFIACQKSRLNSLHVLMEAGADYTITTLNEATPFYQACNYGRGAVAILMLYRFELDDPSGELATRMISQPWGSGATPFLSAAFQGHPQIMSILIVSGADIEIKDKLGRTALDHATADKNKLAKYHLAFSDESLTAAKIYIFLILLVEKIQPAMEAVDWAIEEYSLLSDVEELAPEAAEVDPRIFWEPQLAKQVFSFLNHDNGLLLEL